MNIIMIISILYQHWLGYVYKILLYYNKPNKIEIARRRIIFKLYTYLGTLIVHIDQTRAVRLG